MNFALIISLVSTTISGVALYLSYSAYNDGKNIRLSERFIDIRERIMATKYRCLLCQSNINYIRTDIEGVEIEKEGIKEDYSELIKCLDKMLEYEIGAEELTNKYLDELSLDIKRIESSVELMENRIEQIKNYLHEK